MSNRSSSDYPEHLNPFKRLGLRGSFRELKRNFDIKFRRKEPKKIPNECQVHVTETAPNQDRLNDEEVTLRAHGGHQQHKSEIYPRSRFTERTNKAQTIAPTANPFGEDTPEEQNNNRKSDNPFNDESSENTKATVVDSGKPGGKRYRRKKRAPLPPNRLGANSLELNQSQWSISSYETDCSSTAYNSETAHDEHEPDLNDCVKGLDDIHEISKEIIDYCASVNENQNVSENGVDAKPEIVVSDETESREILQDTANCEVIKDDDKNEETPVCANEDVSKNKSVEIIAGENIEQVDNVENDQSDVIIEPASETPVLAEVVAEKPVSDHVEKKDSDAVEEREEISEIENVVSEPIVVEENCNNRNSPVEMVETNSDVEETVLKKDNNENEEHIHNGNNNFVETKSLYITGSVDNLDASEPIVYREKTAIYITGSRDELSLNPKSVENMETPTPKMRKHKFKR